METQEKLKKELFNKHIRNIEALPVPMSLHETIPLSSDAAQTIVQARKEINKIVNLEDQRMLAIVGPCSIHDGEQAIEYAKKLLELRQEVKEQILIVMRVYFEKPRTVLGWKGLIYDPFIDDSFDMLTGLKKARTLLRDINELGMPCATEMLDPLVPQFIADAVSWTAIGARTTESQTHRQMASGLSMAVGFKNSTNGDFTVAINAAKAAQGPQN